MNESPFSNIVKTLANESTGSNNSLTSSYWKPWIWIILGILAVVVGLSVWNWDRWATSPWLADRLTASQHFWDLLKPVGTIVDPGQMPGGSEIGSDDPAMRLVSETDTEKLLVNDEEAPERKRHRETWCFIGEDKTGRWCLRVPTSHACDPNRTYDSRFDCEMVTASALPLGFLKEGGMSDTPLSAIPALSNTEVV
jgi:hypothetical protein